MSETATTATRGDWQQKAAELDLPSRAFIDGELVDAVSGETFERNNPATGEVLTEVAAGDAQDVDRAVAAARRAFEASRPGVEVREQALVAVLDRPGIEQDEAVFRFVTSDGGEALLRLGRSGDEWVARGIDG